MHLPAAISVALLMLSCGPHHIVAQLELAKNYVCTEDFCDVSNTNPQPEWERGWLMTSYAPLSIPRGRTIEKTASAKC
uniref:Putative secreted protein n=1 Tax=Anopheles darlingi TaxID=43151 RepID=A0A2M4DQQ3_ANODA